MDKFVFVFFFRWYQVVSEINKIDKFLILILFCLWNSKKENDNDSIKDEQVRKDIQVLSSRLYDLRERFMKIVHKINKDANDFGDQISEEGKKKEKILLFILVLS